MKWDYLVTESKDCLCELGEQGWELVTVIPEKARSIFYFKKPRQSLKERITEEQRIQVYNRLSPEDMK